MCIALVGRSRRSTVRETWARGEVFAGGRHLATYAGGASGTTYFNHADWLGTERLRSDITGAACETITGLIFGDGMAVSGGCGDPSTRHFTGKEHDTETGLDDFGARYYSAQMGRFVTADWSAVPAPVPYANLNNPQTLNLYALVHENPATFADLDGHLAPGQLAFSEGMGITPRMRGGNGNAYGCAITGCETHVTVWEVSLPSGVEYFESEALAKATVAEYNAGLEAEGAQKSNKGGQKPEPVGLPDHLRFIRADTMDVAEDAPGTVGSDCVSCYGAGQTFGYELVDRNGRSIVASEGTQISEHIKQLAESDPGVTHINSGYRPYDGVWADRISFTWSKKIGYFYGKSEQTFSVIYKGREYPLSTKIIQYVVHRNNQWIIQAQIIVP